jgi:hypothetical protein
MTKTLLTDKAACALSLGAVVEVVGSWVWARFDTKPDEITRERLKAENFHWNQKRKLWQWAGRPAAGSPLGSNAIRAKYGAFEVKKDDLVAV